jgi:two-component system chemotaxis response regulator CheB/chemosensory pili system protein ChpB (putative protein-glutamate methylesterase)
VPNGQAVFATVPVALLYQGDNLGGHLKDALRDLGADIVYESLASNLDRGALEGCGARIVVFNLDSESDAQIDHVYDVLDEGDYEVVFNDADASAQLSGTDQARWARHLAAKILNKPEIAEPARPVWAESIPTRAQKTAAANASATVTPIAARQAIPAAPVPPAPPVAAPMTFEELTSADVAPPAPPTAAPMTFEELTSADVAPPAPPTAAPMTFEELTAADVAPPTPSTASPMMFEQPASTDEPQPAPPGDTPTLELPVLDAFNAVELEPRTVTDAAEHADAEQDFSAALEDFARQVPTHAYAAPAADDFASQLDALFADTRAADVPPRKAQDADTEGKFAGVESLFAEAIPPVETLVVAQADFPAAFDNLDAAAASIPEAVDRSFKPGRLPAAADTAPPAAENPLLPPDWSLEPLNDEGTPAAPATGRASFGVDKISASDFLAPDSDAEIQVTQLPVGDALSLELMPMEEAVAPHAYGAPAADAGPARDDDRAVSRLKVGASAELQHVFVLGASIGGPEAVREFLGALPPRFPALFVLVQHMGDEFLELMSAQLARAVSLTVRTPTHGEIFGHGEIVIVTTKQRLQIDAEGVVTLSPLPERTAYSPSIDLVLRDLADQFGSKAGAIIFSGMAQDAIAGSTYLKAKGGTVWTQDPNTCTISTMVDAVTQTGAVTFSGSPQELAAKMIADYGAG